MGQKSNPKALRLKITRTWDSVWYANKKQYGTYLIEDIKVRNMIRKIVSKDSNLRKIDIGDIRIKRFPNKMNIVIFTSKPGILIGRKGKDIEFIKKEIERFAKKKINLNIKEIKKPELNADFVAQVVVKQIEGRIAYKRAIKMAIFNSIKSGAKGIKIEISGRLGGADIARSEKYKEGSIPLHTFSADISYASYPAQTQYGKIGIKVWIFLGLVIPKEKIQEEIEKIIKE